MFSQIRYLINNTEIENVMSPGQATTMKGMMTYGDDFSKAKRSEHVLAKGYHGSGRCGKSQLRSMTTADHCQAKPRWDLLFLRSTKSSLWVLL